MKAKDYFFYRKVERVPQRKEEDTFYEKNDGKKIDFSKFRSILRR